LWHGVGVLADAGFDITHAFDTALVAALAPALTARRCAVLVGNTRALWPRFLAAVASDRELAASSDPLDRYTETAIARAYPGAPTWFVHRRYDGDFLPFQKIAVAAGLGVLAPTQLVIHPSYGPWLALRAIVLVDGEPPPHVKPQTSCCTSDCAARLDAALASRDWRAWVAARDACNVGRAFRYSDDQIAYHYTKDRALLPVGELATGVTRRQHRD
jgi:cyanocobalamin reductase (cyanide-eliminating) / alkylcobalamin dealkylase